MSSAHGIRRLTWRGALGTRELAVERSALLLVGALLLPRSLCGPWPLCPRPPARSQHLADRLGAPLTPDRGTACVCTPCESVPGRPRTTRRDLRDLPRYPGMWSPSRLALSPWRPARTPRGTTSDLSPRAAMVS